MKKLFYITAFILIQYSSILCAAHDILILRPEGAIFKQITKGISDDIDPNLTLKEIILKRSLSPRKMDHLLTSESPKLIVLVGNKIANEYRLYQHQYPNNQFPISLLLSSLKVGEFIDKIKNTVAVKYEIPATTSIVQLRRLTNKKIHRVGIIYRRWMRNIVANEEYYCQAELIKLVKIELSNKPSEQELKHKLKELLRQDLDAIVIATDNKLLDPYQIQNIWKPLLARFNNPIVTGIKVLIGKNVDIATLAIIPDSYALGVQAEGIINEIVENNWKLSLQNQIYETLSVIKILNYRLAWKKGINLDSDNLNILDYVLK